MNEILRELQKIQETFLAEEREFHITVYVGVINVSAPDLEFREE